MGKAKVILLAIATTVFIALGQVLFKLASATFNFTVEGFILNYWAWIGFSAYALGLLSLTLSLREGELILIYPVLSLSYIWVQIASFILFSEIISPQKIIGTLIIIAGVSVLGLSPAEKKVGANG